MSNVTHFKPTSTDIEACPINIGIVIRDFIDRSLAYEYVVASYNKGLWCLDVIEVNLKTGEKFPAKRCKYKSGHDLAYMIVENRETGKLVNTYV